MNDVNGNMLPETGARRVAALEAALRVYRTHPADHTWCRTGVNLHVKDGAGRNYDNRCMICVRADAALEGRDA